MNQKGFAPILIVIIIAVLVGGYLLYQNQSKPNPFPTPQLTSTPTSIPESTNSAETANWKTYTNKEIGYSIKYPSDWSFQATSEGCGPVFSPADRNASKYRNINNYWITICGLNVNPGDTPRLAANKILDTPGVKLIDRKDITVNGHYAVEQQTYVSNDSPDQYNGEMDVFISMVNGVIYENGTPKKETGTLAVYTYIKDGYALDEAVRNLLLILSTFKFLP